MYPLLTPKYFDYLKLSMAYSILENTDLTKFQQDKKMLDLINEVNYESLNSPAWNIINHKVLDTTSANKVMSKAWVIGFTEAKGKFYLGKDSDDKILHTFEINQNMPLIVYAAIGRILGIRTNFKNPISKIITKNSRAIVNIIKYYHNNLKGFKSLEYVVWSRSYLKHKGKFSKLNYIKDNIIFKNKTLE